VLFNLSDLGDDVAEQNWQSRGTTSPLIIEVVHTFNGIAIAMSVLKR
jgi:hypothetical protein